MAVNIKKILLKIVLLWLCGLSQGVAVSLGELQLHSFLNQPLDFTVPISLADNEQWNTDDFIVRVASPDEYAKNDLVYLWDIGRIQVEVRESGQDQLVIRGRSPKAVRELLVTVLLNVEWPRGQIQKEYNLLIDVNGVTNIAPASVQQPAAEPQVPQPIELVVEGREALLVLPETAPDSESSIPPSSQPVAVEVLQVEGVSPSDDPVEPSADSDKAVSDSEAIKQSTPRPKALGFPGDAAVHRYTIAQGDALSLIAQRFRGEVDLPLHQYIHAISDENVEQFPEGMEALSVGQTIRIPNPSIVKQSYSRNTRQLDNPEDNVMRHSYTVRYGDSLFLIAQAFKPVSMQTEQFIAVLEEENAQVLGKNRNRLRPGMRLDIPNADFKGHAPTRDEDVVAQSPSSAVAENNVETEQNLEQPDVAAPSIMAIDAAPIAKSTFNDVELFSNIPPTETQGLAPLASAGERRTLTPKLRANLRAIEQYVARDESSLVYDVIQSETRLPLLYEQVLRLNDQLGDLRLEVAQLRLENGRLQTELGELKNQNNERTIGFWGWLLLFVVLLLIAMCVVMYWHICRLASRLDYAVQPALVGATDTQVKQEETRQNSAEEDVPLKTPAERKPLAAAKKLRDKAKILRRQRPSPLSPEVKVGEQDYSDYDFSKSNYDYSQAYDLGQLESEIKSGKNAFAQSEPQVEIKAYDEDISAVHELIEMGDLATANSLLDKLLTADSSRFEHWIVKLELELASGQRSEAEALQAQLLQMYQEPEQQALLASMMPPKPKIVEKEVSQSRAEPAEDKLYEVRVYLSYQHWDLVERSLNELLLQYPRSVNTQLLKLEFLARTNKELEFDVLASELAAQELDKEQESLYQSLCEQMADETSDVTQFDDSTQLLPAEVCDDQEQDDSADTTTLIDEGLTLDEIEELEDDQEIGADLNPIEAETDDEREFLAAIQEQMESYVAEDQADSQQAPDDGKQSIPDNIRIPD